MDADALASAEGATDRAVDGAVDRAADGISAGGCPDPGTALPPPGACQASEVLGRVGDKWSLQVIFSLGGGTRRFTDLKRGIGGISQRMLTVTLRGLERDGIITRTMYPVMPPRVDYALTPMGRTLLDVACNLIGWVHDHLHEIDSARAAYDARERQGSGPFSA
jgi:DNA-binding HxlR family transcriptional regulator